MAETLTSNTNKALGVIDQTKLSSDGRLTDSNISDAVRGLSSLTGTNIVQNKVFSVAYSVARKFGLTSKFKFFSFGVPDEILLNTPPQYMISLVTESNSKRYKCAITAVLQDKVELKTASSWHAIVPTSISNITNALTSGLGLSFQSSLASRRIWMGTEPLKTTVHFKFEAYRDAQKEVVIPCMVLMQLALPGRSFTNAGELFLVPPGPTAVPELGEFFTAASKSLGFSWNPKTTGEETSISLGSFVTFAKVIVEDVDVQFDTRMNSMGDPIGAEAKVTFSTFEIMTKESLENSFNNVTINKDKGGITNFAGRSGNQSFGI